MSLPIILEKNAWSEPFLNYFMTSKLLTEDWIDSKVLIKQTSYITSDDLDSGKPIIALEKTDGANILSKQILKHPSVIRYVKQYNYANYNLHNLPCIDGRLFTRYLCKPSDLQEPSDIITKEDYEKIVLGWNLLHYSKVKPFIDIDPQQILNNKRKIDVFFAGTVHYGNEQGRRKSGDLISEHRNNCVSILKGINNVRSIAISEKMFNYNLYKKIVYNSKIIVSPWGWGEVCYRDYEAILAGCILIKPISDFVISTCGIYMNSACIWVCPDFSNLPQVVDHALKIYTESTAERIAQRNSLVSKIDDLPLLVKSILNCAY